MELRAEETAYRLIPLVRNPGCQQKKIVGVIRHDDWSYTAVRGEWAAPFKINLYS